MKRSKPLQALLALNLVLLAAVALVMLTPSPAPAQFAGVQYIMVAGQSTGRTQQDSIYVIELNSARCISLFYNGSSDNVEIMGGTDMVRDIQGAAGGR